MAKAKTINWTTELGKNGLPKPGSFYSGREPKAPAGGWPPYKGAPGAKQKQCLASFNAWIGPSGKKWCQLRAGVPEPAMQVLPETPVQLPTYTDAPDLTAQIQEIGAVDQAVAAGGGYAGAATQLVPTQVTAAGGALPASAAMTYQAAPEEGLLQRLGWVVPVVLVGGLAFWAFGGKTAIRRARVARHKKAKRMAQRAKYR